jgi:hypothetical protein
MASADTDRAIRADAADDEDDEETAREEDCDESWLRSSPLETEFAGDAETTVSLGAPP